MGKNLITLMPACADSRKPLIYAGIHAGFPSPAQDYVGEKIDLNEVLLRNPTSTHYGRVEGDAFVEMGSGKGDILVIDKAQRPKNGDLVLCLLDGSFALRRIEKRKDGLWLVAPNGKAVRAAEGAELWGVVRHTIKTHRAIKKKGDDGNDLNEMLIGNPNTTFFGRVDGDSLSDAGVDDGDMLIIDRSLSPQHGNLAVCCVDGEFALKYIDKRPDGLWLLPANSAYKPIKVDEGIEFAVWGIVTYSIKAH